MNQFSSQSKEVPEIIPEAGIDSTRLAGLKKDVLRRSVDEGRDGKELAKELKDLAPAAAALIIAMILESFKPEEKEKTEKKEKKSAKGKTEAVVPPAKSEQAKTEAKETKRKKEEVQQEAITESLETVNASDIVVIGDSIPKGMISRFDKGKKPDFIGEIGKSTPWILSEVKKRKENNGDMFQNKTVIISCGGNDLVWTDDYEKVADRIDQMVEQCKGAKEIVLLTRFPYQEDFERVYLKDRSRELRKVILERFRPPRVKVVDLYKHFADKEGNLKDQYVSKGKDKLHPYKAYKDALKIIGRETSTDLESLMG